MNTQKKEQFQQWLNEKNFTYFITIEPTPALPFKIDEIEQRFRTIEFHLNKRYLPSSFPKWKDEDRFWFIIFAEGSAVTNNKHYHILFHTPESVSKRNFWYESQYGLKTDFMSLWGMLPSVTPHNGKVRDRVLMHDIIAWETIANHKGATNYCSKLQNFNEWSENYENERFFFSTPPKITNRRLN